MKNLVEELNDYFANTSQEEIQAMWDKSIECDNIGPAVEDYFKNHPMNDKGLE